MCASVCAHRAWGFAAARAWNRTHVWICMLILCDVQILSTTGTWKKEIRSAFSSAVRPPSLNEPIAEMNLLKEMRNVCFLFWPASCADQVSSQPFATMHSCRQRCPCPGEDGKVCPRCSSPKDTPPPSRQDGGHAVMQKHHDVESLSEGLAFLATSPPLTRGSAMV